MLGYMGNAGRGDGWGILDITHMLLRWILLMLGVVVLAKWLSGGVRGNGRGSRDDIFSMTGKQFDQVAVEVLIAKEAPLRQTVALKCTTPQSKGVLP